METTLRSKMTPRQHHAGRTSTSNILQQQQHHHRFRAFAMMWLLWWWTGVGMANNVVVVVAAAAASTTTTTTTTAVHRNNLGIPQSQLFAKRRIQKPKSVVDRATNNKRGILQNHFEFQRTTMTRNWTFGTAATSSFVLCGTKCGTVPAFHNNVKCRGPRQQQRRVSSKENDGWFHTAKDHLKFSLRRQELSRAAKVVDDKHIAMVRATHICL